jgi:HEAT repeat protein
MRAMRPGSIRATWADLLLAGACSLVPLLIVSLLWIPATYAGSNATPLSDAEPLLAEFGKRAQDQSLPEAERLQDIAVLREWGTAQVRAPLIALLGDPLPSIRTAAAHALGWKGNQDAVAALRQRVEAPDESSTVKAAALDALGRIGDDTARATLLSAIADPDSKVRSAALRGLTFENLTSPTDRVPLLRQIAKDDSLDPLMRCQAIQALGGLKDAGSEEILIHLLEREPVSTMPRPKDSPSEQEIMVIRYKQARDVKAWAVRALVVIGAKAAIPLVLKTAEEPADFFLRLMSVQALGVWKVPEAVPVLVRRLEDPFDQTRAAALWGLGEIGDRTAVDPVLARLSDKAVDVRAQAVNALAELGDPRVRPQLEALQEKDPDPRVQEALQKALASLPR